ncbi:hypothetical protein BHE74_00050651 [Ensete ventricosum]|nr:hypothetical protein BHE74_00050651 [Ensete ventricosum]
MEAGEAASLLASKSAAPCGSQLGRLSWRPVLATWFGVGGRRWRSTKCGVRNGEVTADHSSSYFTPWDEHCSRTLKPKQTNGRREMAIRY